MKRPHNDTVEYKLAKSNKLGFSSLEMTLYSKAAPNGVSYFRPLTQEERGNDAGAGKSRQTCKDEVANETRVCDAQGGSDMEKMMCKNKVMMNHIDCL
jgi:hypothetical protein